MSQEAQDWELSKENIKPIKQGRKTTVLKVALDAHSEDIILKQRQTFEKELRIYSGNDPLVVWQKYIKWIDQNFPKGGREGNIKELIERCLSILKSEKRYYDDDRFIDILLKYAIIGEKPIDVYNYMFSNNIGCKSAKLFINWSWELEQMSNFKKANEILTEGIKRRADPFEKMYSYHQDFEIRIADKIKANVEEIDCELEKSRSAFSVLQPRKKILAPILVTCETVTENEKIPLICERPQPKSKITSVKLPFKIYDSEDKYSSLPIQSQCIAPSDLSSENYKENEQQLSKWNKVKVKLHGLHSKAASDVELGFKFHYDDEETKQQFHTLQSVNIASKILTNQCQSTSLISILESVDPLTRHVYPKNKIYREAEEFSLEEIRADEWFNNRKEKEKRMLHTLQQKREKKELEHKLEDKIRCLVKQVELLQNHSENVMSENNEFNRMLNPEKLKEYRGKTSLYMQNDSNLQYKHNLDAFSFKNNPFTNFCSSDIFESKGTNSTCYYKATRL